MVANSNLLNLYEFLSLPIHFNFASNISTTPDVGQTNLLAIGHSQNFQTISSADLHACLQLGDTFFCKGRKVMETSLKRSCLGALYMANLESIQNHCRFKIAEAREKIFELSENTWAVYSVGTINTNEVCPADNNITAIQIQSGDTIHIKPGCYVRTMDHVISADQSNDRGQDQDDGLGRQNHGPLSLREQRGHPSRCPRTPDPLQWRVWRHHPVRPTGPTPDTRSALDFHFARRHDRSSHLAFWPQFLPMEMLLPDHDVSTTTTIGSPNADASNTFSAGNQPQDNTKGP
jgi:hypothetical protein